jgi:hypothetical protein
MNTTSPPILRRLGALLALAGVAVLVTGCGLKDPNTVALGSSTSTTSAAPASTPTITASQQTASSAGGGNPQAAIEQYAALWCNWTAADLHAHERQLEAISVGGARTQEQLALAAPSQQPGDTGPNDVTNTCKVESLAPGRADAAGKWVLVTASQAATPGTPPLPAQYHVTYITLARQGARYLVDSWLPQS